MINQLLKQKRITVKGNQPWLENLQANILKSHGRDNQLLLLLQFNKSKMPAVKAFLGNLPVTSALEQINQTERHKDADKKRVVILPETVLNLYLTSQGYELLGIKLPEKQEAFRQNLPNRYERKDGEKVHILNDKPNEYESPYGEEIHAMLSIANNDVEIIDQLVFSLEASSGGIIRIIGRQPGQKITNDCGKPIEHFGYADGISQPLFFEDDINATDKRHWNPDAPLGLVLVPDFGIDQTDCYGSYLVYRKLEQNVKAFKEAEEALAQKLDYTGTAEEAAGAMIVGRFEPGLPAIKFGSTHSPEVCNDDNDFDYSFDPAGARCPFHAHIRKTNPRGDSSRFFGISEEEERSHRIVRRGITYGKRDLDEHGHATGKDKPEGEVGLLFLCFQASIEHQFEHMQRSWANNNDFPVPFTGIDPIIGQGTNRTGTNGNPTEQQWRKTDGSRCPDSFSGFVTMKGGGYFFAPSLVFIKSLGNTTSKSAMRPAIASAKKKTANSIS